MGINFDGLFETLFAAVLAVCLGGLSVIVGVVGGWLPVECAQWVGGGMLVGALIGWRLGGRAG